MGVPVRFVIGTPQSSYNSAYQSRQLDNLELERYKLYLIEQEAKKQEERIKKQLREMTYSGIRLPGPTNITFNVTMEPKKPEFLGPVRVEDGQ
jgi:hypothetical protein